MNILRLGWLLLEGMFLLFFLYFGSPSAFVMALLFVLFPLGNNLINLYVKNHLSVSLNVPASLLKGTNGTFEVEVKNTSKIPIFRARCIILMENQLNGEVSQRDIFTNLLPNKTKRFELEAGSNYCGRLKVQMPYIVLYDYFGLIGIRKTCEQHGNTMVLPDTFDMDLQMTPSPNSADDSELYSQERPGMDLSEIYQIRDYVPGDSPRQIHWKLSTKFDRLIARDPSLPITRNVLLFWERTGESGNLELIDAQAEVFVSICRNLLEQSVQFTVGWNDTLNGKCVFQKIHDLDELTGLLPRLLRAKGLKEGITGADLLLQTESHQLCGHMVYLAEEPAGNATMLSQYGRVSMLLCGETVLEEAYMFHEKHYQEQLTKLEL